MGTYEELKAAIQQVIRTNGNNEITGTSLKNVLLSIVNVVGANATFAGIATPDTNPGTADQNVFYLATKAGTYVNFGGIEINEGEAVILSNKTGAWKKTISGFATEEQMRNIPILNKVKITPNETKFKHINVLGKIITSSNAMYLTDAIALSEGDIISFYASTLNESVSAITLCQSDGTPIRMLVRGLAANAKGYFTYVAETDCYVRLSYYDRDATVIWTIKNSVFAQIVNYISEKSIDFPKLNYGIDGDSITEGNQWGYYMLQALGGNMLNVGVGSACWSYKQKYNIAGNVLLTPQNYTDSDFAGFGGASNLTTDENIQKWVNNNACTHIEKFIYEVERGIFSTPDVFIFAMGTNNDTGNGNTDGTVDEAMNPESIEEDVFVDSNGKSLKYTMCGAMRWCIQKIKTLYPNCKVFISLPIQRAQYSVNSTYLYPKSLLIKEMAVQMGCQIIDQYNGCGITAAIENDATPFGPYLRDGLHPNVEGQKLMGAFAAQVVKTKYFK